MLDEILKVLVTLKSNLTSLLDVIIAKQRALISLNHDALESSILNEEKVLAAIRECEQERIKVLDQFYSKNSLNHSTYKISELCEKMNSKVNDPGVKKLLILENQIKDTIGEIDRINHQNIYIIEHSRTFIKDTISSLVSANKKFLDKRV